MKNILRLSRVSSCGTAVFVNSSLSGLTCFIEHVGTEIIVWEAYQMTGRAISLCAHIYADDFANCLDYDTNPGRDDVYTSF